MKWLEISRIYYESGGVIRVLEFEVVIWPSDNTAHATWLGGYKTGFVHGGRTAEGYVISIKFTPPNPGLQERFHNLLKIVRSFEMDLGNGVDTVERIWFNSAPDHQGVKRIHCDTIVKFTKLLKEKNYRVACESPFLSDYEFLEKTAVTNSEKKELEEIQKQEKNQDESIQKQRLSGFVKIAEIKKKRLADEKLRRKLAGEPPMTNKEIDDIMQDTPTLTTAETSRLNREQLIKRGKETLKQEKKAFEIRKSAYVKKRQLTGVGKKVAIIIPILTLVLLAVVFVSDVDLDSNEKIFSANLVLDSINNIELPNMINEWVDGCKEYDSISVNSQTTSGKISLLLCDGEDLTVSAKLSKSAQVQLQLIHPKSKSIWKTFIDKEFEYVINPNFYDVPGTYKIQTKIDGKWLTPPFTFKFE